MAQTITLDKADPAVNELIGGWKDGESYDVTLKQVSTEGTIVTFEATPAEPAEGDTEDESAAGPAPEPAAEGPGKHKPALMVLIGNHGKEG